MAYQVKLEVFEGPFDLLFHLLNKNEIDIYDIPIAQITEQYLNYLQQMQLMDLEVTSEFLVMAAKLISIKAKMLLPKPSNKEEGDSQAEVDPRDELIQRLMEYKKFKQVSEMFREKEAGQGRVFSRPNEEEMFAHLFEEPNPLEGIHVGRLFTALKEVLDRVVEKDIPPEPPHEDFSIRDKMGLILRRLIFRPNGMAFTAIFAGQNNKVEIIATFLALLELIKLKKVAIQQSTIFGEITLYSRREEIND